MSGAQVNYYAGMKRTTIAITDDLALALEVEAKRTGNSVSAIARRALEEHLSITKGHPRKLGFAALAGSGPSNTGERIEALLEESGFGEPRTS